jgi:hypothetical protein
MLSAGAFAAMVPDPPENKWGNTFPLLSLLTNRPDKLKEIVLALLLARQ